MGGASGQGWGEGPGGAGGGGAPGGQHEVGRLPDGEREVLGSARGGDAEVAPLQRPAQPPAVCDGSAPLALCLLCLRAARHPRVSRPGVPFFQLHRLYSFALDACAFADTNEGAKSWKYILLTTHDPNRNLQFWECSCDITSAQQDSCTTDTPAVAEQAKKC